MYVLINLRAVHRVRAQRAERTAAAEGNPARTRVSPSVALRAGDGGHVYMVYN